MDIDFGHHGSSDRDHSNPSSVRYSRSSSFYSSASFTPQPTRAVRHAPFSNMPLKINAPSSPNLSISLSSPLETGVPGPATPPSNYVPPSPPPSSFEKSLQQSLIPPSAKAIFQQLSQHLRKHRFALHSDQHPLQIDNVSPANFQTFLTAHCHDDILKGIDLEYDSFAGQIIMCPPPAPYHDCMPVFLQTVLVGLRSTQFDTLARQRTLSVREIRFRSPGGSYMVPDASVVVMSADGDIRVWPTIVVEVANSQAYDNVLQKVRRWFVQSDGMVEVVLVLKFTAKNPLLDPACYLETWRYREVVECDEPSRSDNDSQMELDGDGSSGGESTKQSDDDPDVVDDPNVEVEYSDPQTTPLKDSHSGGVSTVIPTPAEEDSDSSLSSLSSDSDAENEVDLAMDESPHSASTNSTASASSSPRTSDYDPHPMHEIFLSGARKTVLPVDDPADPEMRHLALRYSDIFGSENVPAGRDPAEEVLLDLDDLRDEIKMLIRLTAKQEETIVKRQAGADGGGDAGRKRVRR